MDKELLNNIDKIHTTEMGVDRIKRNLNIDGEVEEPEEGMKLTRKKD